MKVKDVFNRALALLAEDNGDAYKFMVVESVNQIMADLLHLTDKTDIELVGTLEDEIPFPETLVQKCFAYGLCVLFAQSDDEYTKAGYFNQKYVDAQFEYANSQKAVITKVVDVYATTEAGV